MTINEQVSYFLVSPARGDFSDIVTAIMEIIAGLADGQLRFFGIDLGSLAIGARLVQFPGGPLPALNLVRFA